MSAGQLLNTFEDIKTYLNSLVNGEYLLKSETNYNAPQGRNKFLSNGELNKLLNLPVITQAQVDNFVEAFDRGDWNAAIVSDLVTDDATKIASASAVYNLKGMIDNINALIASDDTSLDELQEIVDFIKNNKQLLDGLNIANVGGLQAALDAKIDAVTANAEFARLDGNNMPFTSDLSVTSGDLSVSNGAAGVVKLTLSNDAGTGRLRLNGADQFELFNEMADDLLFGTSNVERARITSGGNFLVNSTTDTGEQFKVIGSSKLQGSVEVTGEAKFRSTLTKFYGTGAESDRRLTLNVTTSGLAQLYNYDETNATFHQVEIGGNSNPDTGLSVTDSGQVIVSEFISHRGDGDTYMGFLSDDRWRVVTGGYVAFDSQNGNAELKHLGGNRLTTTSSGINVFGGAPVLDLISNTAGGYITFTGTGGVNGYLGSMPNLGLGGASDDITLYANGNSASIATAGENRLVINDTQSSFSTDLTVDGEILINNTGNTSENNINFRSQSGTQRAYFGYNQSDGNAYFFNVNPTGAFRIGTDNTERFRILSNGNVGIGTSTPDSALDIEANDANLIISDLGPNNDPGDTQSALTLKGRYYSGDNNLTFSQARMRLIKAADDGYAGSALAFDVMDANYGLSELKERMRIDADGNVGIGTDSPSAPLHISRPYSPSYGQLVLQDPGGIGSNSTIYESYYDSTGTRLAVFGFGRYSGTNDPDYYFSNEQTGGGIRFRTGGIDRFTVANSGNVGIGTNNPSYGLDVQTIQNTVAIRANASTSGNTLFYGTGAVAGHLFLYNTAISATSDVIANLQNNGTGGAKQAIVTAGEGDAYSEYVISGIQGYSLGIDNSDDNKFKLTTGSSPSVGTEVLSVSSTGVSTFPNQVNHQDNVIIQSGTLAMDSNKAIQWGGSPAIRGEGNNLKLTAGSGNIQLQQDTVVTGNFEASGTEASPNFITVSNTNSTGWLGAYFLAEAETVTRGAGIGMSHGTIAHWYAGTPYQSGDTTYMIGYAAGSFDQQTAQLSNALLKLGANGDLEIVGNINLGSNDHGNSILRFYDDNSDTQRSLQWSDSANEFQIEDNTGTMRTVLHSGNIATYQSAIPDLNAVVSAGGTVSGIDADSTFQLLPNYDTGAIGLVMTDTAGANSFVHNSNDGSTQIWGMFRQWHGTNYWDIDVNSSGKLTFSQGGSLRATFSSGEFDIETDIWAHTLRVTDTANSTTAFFLGEKLNNPRIRYKAGGYEFVDAANAWETIRAESVQVQVGTLSMPSGEKIHWGGESESYIEGSSVSNNFKIGTAGINRLTITDTTAHFTGNVGAGTVPSYKFHMQDTHGEWYTNAYGGMYFRNTSDTDNIQYLHARSDGGLSIGRVAIASLSGSDTATYADTSYDRVHISASGDFKTLSGSIEVNNSSGQAELRGAALYLNKDQTNSSAFVSMDDSNGTEWSVGTGIHTNGAFSISALDRSAEVVRIDTAQVQLFRELVVNVANGASSTSSFAGRVTIGTMANSNWALTVNSLGSGAALFNGDVQISSSQPKWTLSETDTTDNNWQGVVSGGAFYIRAINDDLSSGAENVLYADRDLLHSYKNATFAGDLGLNGVVASPNDYGRLGVSQSADSNTEGIAVIGTDTSSLRLWVDSGRRKIGAGGTAIIDYDTDDLIINAATLLDGDVRASYNADYGTIRFGENTNNYVIGYNASHPQQANEISVKSTAGDVTLFAGSTASQDVRLRVASDRVTHYIPTTIITSDDNALAIESTDAVVRAMFTDSNGSSSIEYNGLNDEFIAFGYLTGGDSLGWTIGGKAGANRMQFVAANNEFAILNSANGYARMAGADAVESYQFVTKAQLDVATISSTLQSVTNNGNTTSNSIGITRNTPSSTQTMINLNGERVWRLETVNNAASSYLQMLDVSGGKIFRFRDNYNGGQVDISNGQLSTTGSSTIGGNLTVNGSSLELSANGGNFNINFQSTNAQDNQLIYWRAVGSGAEYYFGRTESNGNLKIYNHTVGANQVTFNRNDLGVTFSGNLSVAANISLTNSTVRNVSVLRANDAGYGSFETGAFHVSQANNSNATWVLTANQEHSNNHDFGIQVHNSLPRFRIYTGSDYLEIKGDHNELNLNGNSVPVLTGTSDDFFKGDGSYDNNPYLYGGPTFSGTNLSFNSRLGIHSVNLSGAWLPLSGGAVSGNVTIGGGGVANTRLVARGATNDSSLHAFEAAQSSGASLFLVRNDGYTRINGTLDIHNHPGVNLRVNAWDALNWTGNELRIGGITPAQWNEVTLWASGSVAASFGTTITLNNTTSFSGNIVMGNAGLGGSGNRRLNIQSDTDDVAIAIAENSGGEAFGIGVDVDGSLGFHNSTAGTLHTKLHDNGDLIVASGNVLIEGEVAATQTWVTGQNYTNTRSATHSFNTSGVNVRETNGYIYSGYALLAHAETGSGWTGVGVGIDGQEGGADQVSFYVSGGRDLYLHSTGLYSSVQVQAPSFMTGGILIDESDDRAGILEVHRDSTNSYAGYGIDFDGQHWMLMGHSTLFGIYDDTAGQWALQYNMGAGINLRYGGSKKFETLSAGVKVTGTLEATGVITAAGGNSTQWNTAYGWGDHSGLYLPLSGGTVTGTVTLQDTFTVNANAQINGHIRADYIRDDHGGNNANLGSAGSEGRGLVAGYSGSSYGGIGYNVRHTSTGGSYIAPGGDSSSYITFNNGFTFSYAGTGTAGRTLSYAQLAKLSTNGLDITGQINTGQGWTEVHLMNQNIRSTDSPTFAHVYVPSGGAVGLANDCEITISDANPTWFGNGYGGTFTFTGDSSVDAALIYAGGIEVRRSILVGDKIGHYADEDTYMQFHDGNQWRVVAGGTERLEVSSTGATVNGRVQATNLGVRRSGINIDTAGNDDFWDYIHTTSSTDGTFPTSYMYLVNFGDKSQGIQLAKQFGSNTDLYFRGGSDNPGSENGANTYNNWRLLLDATNYSNYAVPKAGGTFSGAVTVNGNVTASNFIDVSDSHLKEELNVPLPGLELLKKLEPKIYRKDGFTESGFYADQLPEEAQYMRHKIEGNYWGMDYKNLHAVEVTAIRELSERVEELETEKINLQSRVDSLEEKLEMLINKIG